MLFGRPCHTAKWDNLIKFVARVVDFLRLIPLRRAAIQLK